MIVEGQTELLDAIEEAWARLGLARAMGSREVTELATELSYLERLVALPLLSGAHRPSPGECTPSIGRVGRVAAINGRGRSRPILPPGCQGNGRRYR